MNINLVLIRDSMGAFQKYVWLHLVFTMTGMEKWANYPAARVVIPHKKEVICMPHYFPVLRWVFM